MKICRSCLIEKLPSEFYKGKASCKACVSKRVALYAANHQAKRTAQKRAHYIAHKDRADKLNRKWRKANPAKNKSYKLKDRMRLRQEMLDAYGRQCECCGETNEGFLTLDHIGRNGKAHRTAVGPSQVYRDLRKRGWPKDGLRILCMNCNWAIRFGGLCPHRERGAR